MHTNWTDCEITILKELYPQPNKNKEMLEKLSNFTYWAIRHKARKLGLKRYTQWNEDELILLKKLYPISDWTKICASLPRFTKKTIFRKAKTLKLYRKNWSKRFHWTPAEENLLKQLYPWAEPEELYEKLFKFTKPAIAHKAKILGIKRKRRVSFDLNKRGFIYVSKTTGAKFNANTNDYGYVSIQYEGKNILAHRYEMQKKLGRKLLKTEEIHHIDGNKQNNDPDNLVVSTTRKEHKNFNTIRAKLAKQFLKKHRLWEEFSKFETSNQKGTS